MSSSSAAAPPVRSLRPGLPRIATHAWVCRAGPSDEGNRAVLELRRSEELLGTDLDYDYAIDMQLIGNSRIRQSRGRVLGGCSSHNTGVAFLAPDHDLQEWAEAGGTGWGPEQCQPFFRRLLDRVHTERASDANACTRAFVTAAQEAGYPLIDFKRSSAGDGVGWFQLNVKDGSGSRVRSATCTHSPTSPKTLGS